MVTRSKSASIMVFFAISFLIWTFILSMLSTSSFYGWMFDFKSCRVDRYELTSKVINARAANSETDFVVVGDHDFIDAIRASLPEDTSTITVALRTIDLQQYVNVIQYFSDLFRQGIIFQAVPQLWLYIDAADDSVDQDTRMLQASNSGFFNVIVNFEALVAAIDFLLSECDDRVSAIPENLLWTLFMSEDILLQTRQSFQLPENERLEIEKYIWVYDSTWFADDVPSESKAKWLSYVSGRSFQDDYGKSLSINDFKNQIRQ